MAGAQSPSTPPPPISRTPSRTLQTPPKMSLSEQISAVQEHLEALNSRQTTELDDRLLTTLVNRVTLDRAAATEDSAATLSLLQTVTAVLLNDQLVIDYDQVIELLDALLSQLDYDTVSRHFDLDYILEALASPNQQLQTVALKVISKAQPPDILANTEVVPSIIDILANKDTSVKVVNEIEKSLGVLFMGELIRRRVLTKDVTDVLYRMKNSIHTIVVARFMDLMLVLTRYLSPDEAPKELYQFDIILGEDIVLLLSLIKFYSDMMEIGSEPDREWVFDKIDTCYDAIGALYRDRDEQPDIQLALGSIQEFFKKLSYNYPAIFHVIDERYINISKDDKFLLATLNPVFLVSKYPAILKTIPVTTDTLLIVRNLISNKMSFTAITPQLTSSQILRLPYLELMALTVKLSQFEYSAQYLLNDLPQVMNKLLKGDNVIESDTWRLRRATLENLLRLPHEVLDVWHAAVEVEYNKIVKGRSINPDVEVMDVAL